MAPMRQHLRDPRLYQIATLACLLVYGTANLDFEIRPWVVIAIVTTALVIQWGLAAFCGRPKLELRSALISTLANLSA